MDLAQRAKAAAVRQHRGKLSTYIAWLIERDLREDEPKRQALLARLTFEERRLLGLTDVQESKA